MVKDWIYFGIMIAAFAIAVIAGVYAKDKSKINKATRAGKVLDFIGQAATYAVHEAEYSGMDNEQKRQSAAQMVSQILNVFHLKATPAMIDGAIEAAVKGMKGDLGTPEIAKNVPDADIVQETKPQETQATEPEAKKDNA